MSGTAAQQQRQASSIDEAQTPRGGGGGGKPINTCVKCGKSSYDLHLCVHCSDSQCFNCRKQHVDVILGEYSKNRKEAKQVKQQCEQIINTLDTSGVELSQSYAKAEVQIKEAFEKLEEALRQRKLGLVRQLRSAKDEEMKRLKKDQKELEADVGVTTRKLELNCGTQAKSIQGELGVKYKLLDDTKFAHLCSLEFKSRECLNDFNNTLDFCQTKEVAEKVYFDQEQLTDLIALIDLFGDATVGQKENNARDPEE
ncbi:uncharacterized protein LOC142353071 [Convolutriloba macropyga]|uniref:uncharacterized protein LOC142353071 n=1 Tax=Convolutriloba macropyga TaxID=536237 RepID=UPI003F522251